MPPSLSETEEVILKGHKAHVAAARDYIVSRMAQAQTLQSLAIHNIPKDKHKYIVGPKGAGVAGIYAATGVTVTVPPMDDSTSSIVLRGDGAALSQYVGLLVPLEVGCCRHAYQRQYFCGCECCIANTLT